MKYCLDAEFVEGVQTKKTKDFSSGESKPTIDLISIGIVSENGRKYYAISKDFNLKEAWDRIQITTGVDEKPYYWIRENVLKSIFKEINKETTGGNIDKEFSYKNLESAINLFGKSNKQIAEEIKEFVYSNEGIRKPISPDANVGYIAPPNVDIQFYGWYSSYDWVVFCWLFGIMSNIPKYFPYYCRDIKQIVDEKGLTEEWVNKNAPKPDIPHNALFDAEWSLQVLEAIEAI